MGSGFAPGRLGPQKPRRLDLALGSPNAAVGIWGGKDSNLRPTDYESAALTN
jgi:hypothetical protein